MRGRLRDCRLPPGGFDDGARIAQFSPSAVAAAAVSYTLEKIWGVRWDSMQELHKMSGYTKHDLAKVYAFFDRLISDAYDSEELGGDCTSTTSIKRDDSLAQSFLHHRGSRRGFVSVA